ncbi:unnamed protein product [Ceutorhynchus assimilis]|uniref:Uncharacterized protein n=1 Tax=Ceutorhynchus assimilis TaxID=467358 RepID=A0A9P0DGK9_9CUCU|nr:unnamed protein product [Ceutorhynchus assimilis]
MAVCRAIFLFICVFYLSDEIVGQSDLRSALAAIDRRQKELADYEEKQYGYNPVDPEDNLAFLSNAAGGINKHYLRELWDRYYGNDVNYPKNAISKRYYPLYGVENIGLRKRGNYLSNDDEPIIPINYLASRDDDSDQMNYPGNRYLRYQSHNNPYGGSKSFLLAKRSSNLNNDKKRSLNMQTDPKVKKDLSDIFGNDLRSDIGNNKLGDAIGTTTNKPEETTEKREKDTPTRKIEKKDKPKMDATRDDLNKEIFAPVALQNKQEIQIRKKSIDWSDYFGLDRRKKSDSNEGLDNEWLMERYHKAIAITPKKRNAELPIQSLRNHDNPQQRGDFHGKEEQKIIEMDKKLEKLENKIVGDALKYTGAHQVETDSKENQQIKDNIISRLAQAYNIEKMRNALEEYKIEVEKARKEVEKARQEVKKANTDDRQFSDYTMEEKRVSVPRKEAIDDSRDNGEPDNNIKCRTAEECHEQNFKIPSGVLDNHFSNLECPAIQRACNDVASLVGHYGHVFEPACTLHQMCLLCSNNSWFSPTRQCNSLFITKAFELCLGKDECKKEARRSLRYLLDINKSLQAQTALTDECELQCPNTDIFK